MTITTMRDRRAREFGRKNGGGADTESELGRNFIRATEEVKTFAKSAGEKFKQTDARLSEIEQLMVQTRGGSSVRETLGALMAEKAADLAQIGKQRGRVMVETKAILSSATTDADGSAGALLVPDFQSAPIGLARRKLRMRDLFVVGPTTQGAIHWARQTSRTIGAETQAEGATKGQSEMRLDLDIWPVQTIAHWFLASKQMLDDAPALGTLIDAELRYGLGYVEDNQLLNGAGTGTDLQGVYTTAAAYSAPIVPTAAGNMNKLDVLLLAIAQVEDSDYEADGIVLNPIDWRDVQLHKDDVGRYLGNGPIGADEFARLWQMPVVTTKAMTQGKFMVGSFAQGAMIFDRQEATVEASTEDSDNFRKNLVTIRGEERLAFVHMHDEAFVKGDFNDALAA
jgi:HK97 family phage major capsid protein